MQPPAWREPLPLWLEKTLLVAFVWGVFLAGYFGTSAANATRDAWRLDTALDRAIPLVPAWSLVYTFVYFSVVAPAFVVGDRRYFRWVAAAYLASLGFSFVCFVAFPVRIDRPDPFSRGDDFFAWFLALAYRLDHPTNCFPSLHIANAYLAALSCRRVDRISGALFLALATLVSLSTLLVKQHYAADVVAGFALAAAIDRVVLASRAPRAT